MIEDLNYLASREEKENNSLLISHDDPYEAAKDSHAIAILTEWDEFKTLDWQKIYDNMLKPSFVFDGRNILDKNKLKEIGFKVYSIGK
jgi:UDPglucose 6-dehydrogenase